MAGDGVGEDMELHEEENERESGWQVKESVKKRKKSNSSKDVDSGSSSNGSGSENEEEQRRRSGVINIVHSYQRGDWCTSRTQLSAVPLTACNTNNVNEITMDIRKWFKQNTTSNKSDNGNDGETQPRREVSLAAGEQAAASSCSLPPEPLPSPPAPE
ncbi:hypothetical protein ABVT39_002773 [Epinephelus coioides]